MYAPPHDLQPVTSLERSLTKGCLLLVSSGVMESQIYSIAAPLAACHLPAIASIYASKGLSEFSDPPNVDRRMHDECWCCRLLAEIPPQWLMN